MEIKKQIKEAVDATLKASAEPILESRKEDSKFEEGECMSLGENLRYLTKFGKRDVAIDFLFKLINEHTQDLKNAATEGRTKFVIRTPLYNIHDIAKDAGVWQEACKHTEKTFDFNISFEETAHSAFDSIDFTISWGNH